MCRVTYIIFIILGIYSCSNNKKTKVSTPQYHNEIDFSKIDSHNPIDSCLENTILLPLQTDSTCLMGYIDKIEISSPYIFILDFNHNLFIYKNNGTFVKKISATGRGPKDITRLRLFYLDPYKNTINIYDDLKQQIFKFDFQGKLLKTIPCSNPIFNSATEMKLIEENKLLITLEYSPKTSSSFVIVNTHNYKTLSKQMEYPYHWTKTSIDANLPKQFHNQTGHYALNMLSDTIYQYHENKFIPYLIFKSSLSNFTGLSPHIVTEYADIVAYIQRRNISHGISRIIMTDSIGYAEYYYNKNMNHVFWNLITHKATYIPNIGGHTNPLKDFNICTATEQYFVGFFLPYQINPNIKYFNRNTKNNKILSDLQEDDNPVLVFYPIHI